MSCDAHKCWWQIKPGLVAQPTQSQNAASKLSAERPIGRIVQLYLRIQKLDPEAPKKDLRALMTDSQDW